MRMVLYNSVCHFSLTTLLIFKFYLLNFRIMRKGSKNLLKNKKICSAAPHTKFKIGHSSSNPATQNKDLSGADENCNPIACMYHTDFKRPETQPRMPKKLSKRLAILR